MDINKPVANPELVNVIRGLRRGENSESEFWKAVFRARFLCPVNMNLGKTTQKRGQKIELGEGTQITLLSLTNEHGQPFLMAFTDWNELRKWSRAQDQQALVFSYEDYRGIITKSDSPYLGVVINPFGENLVLGKDLLSNTTKTEQMVNQGETVMLGIPKEYPTAMVEMLKRYFVQTGRVRKAYLLWMVRGDEAGYLLVLDSATPPQQLFPPIGQICEPFLNGKLLDMTLANSALGRSAIDGQKSFFVAG